MSVAEEGILVNNLSIARKNMLMLALFTLPFLLTAYVLVGARTASITSVSTEIAGINDIRPLQALMELLAGDAPARVDVIPATAALKKTLAADPQQLAETARTQALLSALSGIGLSTAPLDAVRQVKGMISSIGANAGLVRDPDVAAGLLGDVMVRHLPELLKQAKELTVALAAAETDRQTGAGHAITEAHRIAFHESADNLSAASAAVVTAVNKAILANADGTVKAALDKPSAALTAAVGDVNAAIADKSADGVRKGVAETISAAQAFSAALDGEMAHLLRARAAGIQSELFLHLGLSFLLLLAGLLFALRATSSVSVPLRELEAVLHHMADGGLNISIPALERKDEVGALAGAMEALRRKSRAASMPPQPAEKEAGKDTQTSALAGVLGGFDEEMRGILETLSSAATALEATADEMGATVTETAARAGNVSAAADQAAANVQTAAASAEELSSAIAEISRQVGSASAVAAEAMEAVSAANAGMQTLSKNAEEIGNVVALITAIAGQTNLLALNATIEAARAGDAGKGFAVVAGEVKNLAGQTGQATDSIGRQIAAIQKSTGAAVAAIGQISGVIEKINQSQAAIASAIEQQGAATREIARSVSEASAGNAEVSQHITGINVAAEKGGESAARLKTAVAELVRHSSLIRSEVEKIISAVRAA